MGVLEDVDDFFFYSVLEIMPLPFLQPFDRLNISKDEEFESRLFLLKLDNR